MWHYKLVALVSLLLTHSVAAFAATEVKPQHRSSGVVTTPFAAASAAYGASAPATSTCFITKPCEPPKPLVKKPRPKKMVTKAASKPTPVEVVQSVPEYTPPPVVAQATTHCTEKSYKLFVWEQKAVDVPGVRQVVERTKKQEEAWALPDRVSRNFGGTFRAMNLRDELTLASRSYEVKIFHRAQDLTVKARLYEGPISKTLVLPLPVMVEGDFINVLFGMNDMVSPHKGDLRAYAPEFVSCQTYLHAIEARQAVFFFPPSRHP
jgi:hypothetical protein